MYNVEFEKVTNDTIPGRPGLDVYDLDDLHFVIEPPIFYPETGLAEFHYEMRGHRFVERLWFPLEGMQHQNVESDAFRTLLDLAAIASGQRYYTLLAPHFVETSCFRLSKYAIMSIVDFYSYGLLPFLMRNELDPLLQFASHPDLDKEGHGEIVTGLYLEPGTLLMIGDDINSVVAQDLLVRMEEEHALFAINPTEQTREIAQNLGAPLIEITREHDPLLTQLASADGYYTPYACEKPILALVASLAAALYSFRNVATINDRSPKSKDVHFADGVRFWYSEDIRWDINLYALIKETTSGAMHCYPLLGPFPAIDVSGKFSRTPDTCDRLISSCENRDMLEGEVAWCGKCDHCLREFVLTGLYAEDERTLAMFGGNYLDRPENIMRYRQLAGMGRPTPHWCEEEQLEIAASLWIYMQSDDWGKFAVCKALEPALNKAYNRGFWFWRKTLSQTFDRLRTYSSNYMMLLPADVRDFLLAEQ